jgi:hypothetical protein
VPAPPATVVEWPLLLVSRAPRAPLAQQAGPDEAPRHCPVGARLTYRAPLGCRSLCIVHAMCHHRLAPGRWSVDKPQRDKQPLRPAHLFQMLPLLPAQRPHAPAPRATWPLARCPLAPPVGRADHGLPKLFEHAYLKASTYCPRPPPFNRCFSSGQPPPHASISSSFVAINDISHRLSSLPLSRSKSPPGCSAARRTHSSTDGSPERHRVMLCRNEHSFFGELRCRVSPVPILVLRHTLHLLLIV